MRGLQLLGGSRRWCGYSRSLATWNWSSDTGCNVRELLVGGFLMLFVSQACQVFAEWDARLRYLNQNLQKVYRYINKHETEIDLILTAWPILALEYFPTFWVALWKLLLKALRLGVFKHRTVHECSIQLSGAVQPGQVVCRWLAPRFLLLVITERHTMSCRCFPLDYLSSKKPAEGLRLKEHNLLFKKKVWGVWHDDYTKGALRWQGYMILSSCTASSCESYCCSSISAKWRTCRNIAQMEGWQASGQGGWRWEIFQRQGYSYSTLTNRCTSTSLIVALGMDSSGWSKKNLKEMVLVSLSLSYSSLSPKGLEWLLCFPRLAVCKNSRQRNELVWELCLNNSSLPWHQKNPFAKPRLRNLPWW